MLETYTKCFHSEESDRLPAMFGIVKRINSQIGDSFVAGFWLSQLPRDLLWIRALGYDTATAGTGLSKSRHAPTWSWANVNFPIWSRGLNNHRGKVIVASVTIDDIPSHETTTLTLRGKLLSVKLHQNQHTRPIILEVETLLIEYLLSEGALSTFAYWDDPTLQYPYISNVVCVKIYEHERNQDDEGYFRIVGLILKLFDGIEQCYKRAGVFYVQEPAYGFYKIHESQNEQIIQNL